MPKYTPEYEEGLKIAIRDFITIDPSVSINRLTKFLKEKKFATTKGNELDEKYISRLLKEIRREQMAKVDKAKLSERVAEIKEHHRIIYEKLVKIAFYTKELMEAGMPVPSYKEQIEALKTINKLDLDILQVEINAGMFEEKID